MKYYQRVPAAAAYPMFDGKLYANMTARMEHLPNGKIAIIESPVDDYRMMPVSFIRNGEAYAYIGKIGDAIAQTTNLPFSVSAFPDKHEVE